MSPAVKPILALVMLCVLCSCAAPSGNEQAEMSDPPSSPGPPSVPADAFKATAVRVIDGDTFLASRAGKRVRVRLIGIDAPESVQPEEPVDCFGPQSAARLRSLLPTGSVIRASYQGEKHQDRFGRELWDVWLRNGTFLQAALVRDGSARARAYLPHTRYAEPLAAEERVARAARVGLHAACRT